MGCSLINCPMGLSCLQNFTKPGITEKLDLHSISIVFKDKEGNRVQCKKMQLLKNSGLSIKAIKAIRAIRELVILAIHVYM